MAPPPPLQPQPLVQPQQPPLAAATTCDCTPERRRDPAGAFTQPSPGPDDQEPCDPEAPATYGPPGGYGLAERYAPAPPYYGYGGGGVVYGGSGQQGGGYGYGSYGAYGGYGGSGGYNAPHGLYGSPEDPGGSSGRAPKGCSPHLAARVQEPDGADAGVAGQPLLPQEEQEADTGAGRDGLSAVGAAAAGSRRHERRRLVRRRSRERGQAH
eukprot:XP_001702623.1 predicted protein [Chlamydomonas reinhardtii]